MMLGNGNLISILFYLCFVLYKLFQIYLVLFYITINYLPEKYQRRHL